MLIPRVSLRTYFVATLVLAIFCVVLGFAVDGREWAAGVSLAIIGAVGALAMYAVLFAIAWVFVEGRMAAQHPQPASPFITDEPPKQVMPPVDM